MSPSGPAPARAHADQRTIALARTVARHTRDAWARRTLATSEILIDLCAAAQIVVERSERGLDRMSMATRFDAIVVYTGTLIDLSPRAARAA